MSSRLHQRRCYASSAFGLQTPYVGDDRTIADDAAGSGCLRRGDVCLLSHSDVSYMVVSFIIFESPQAVRAKCIQTIAIAITHGQVQSLREDYVFYLDVVEPVAGRSHPARHHTMPITDM